MLFGGQELPERPLWIRLLTIAIVLSVASPVIQPGVAVLQDQFLKMRARFLKMGAEETAAQLATHPLWGAGPASTRDTRCEPGSGGWDYVCSFNYQSTQHRMKVGVRVEQQSIASVSVPHELNDRRLSR